MTLWLLLAAIPFFVTPALAEDRARIDLFDAQSRRQGYAIIDRDTGRIDTYDKDSRRTGYGKIAPDGRGELYAPDGKRHRAAPPLSGSARRR